MNKKIVLLVLVLVSLPSVFALGLAPGRSVVNYVPGDTRTIEFTIYNSNNKDIGLEVSVEGDLEEFVTVGASRFNMAASESEKTLSYTVNLPQQLAPGRHTTDIILSEIPSETRGSDSYVEATLAVATQLDVNVPYPGKYVGAELEVYPNKEGTYDFVVPVVSRGEFDIVKLYAQIDIFTPLNEKVTTLSTEAISLASLDNGVLKAVLTENVATGPYRAEVSIFMDDETPLNFVKEFNIGGASLELIGLEINDFSLGDIAKFEATVENKGGQNVADAFLRMLVFNDEGGTIADFKSPTSGVNAFEKAKMVLFWDTAGVHRGLYDSKLVVDYDGERDEKDLQLKISENNIEIIGLGYVISKQSGRGFDFGGSTTVMLLIVVAVLVLINLSWFLYLRKRLKKR